MKRAAFIHSEALEKFRYPDETPLSSERAAKTLQLVSDLGFINPDTQRVVPPEIPGRPELERFHTPDYLDILKKASDGIFDEAFLSMGLGTADCPLFAGMYEYSAAACGATLTGAELILAGDADVTFNPSGGYHHAGPDYAAGFCYMDDVVLGCMRLAANSRRVVYLDVDAHHCDAVQNAFYESPEIMTVSMHESGKTLYPGTGFENETGVGRGKGFCVNIPLPVGTYDEVWLRAFREVPLPLIRAFDPDVIVLQLGMDALALDPLAHLNLTNNAFADMLAKVKELGKPILVTGGGGYHEENTIRGWVLAWSILTDSEPEEDLSVGMGGVMLESTEYQGGLRDRMLLTHGGQRKIIDATIEESLSTLKKLLFPVHGLDV